MAPAAAKIIHRKTQGFGKVLWDIRLDAIEEKVTSLENSTNRPHSNFIEGLSQIIPALDTFLDTSSQDSENEDFFIRVYDAVHLETGEILRTAGEFQGKEWFSNVGVTSAEDQDHYRSDEGAWYGKVRNFNYYQSNLYFKNLKRIFSPKGFAFVKIFSRVSKGSV